jgi:phosphorylase kinase alpha/beta subunit
VRLGWLDRQPERESTYAADKAAAWQSFYRLSPGQCATYIAKALEFLTQLGRPKAA